MLNGLLTRLEISLVGPVARFKPRNVLWGRDCLCRCAVLAVADAGRAAIASHLATLLRRSWRWRHLDNIGEGAGCKVILVAMAMPAPFSMVLLSLFNYSGSEGWEGIRIVRGRSRLSHFFLLMPAVWPRPGALSGITIMVVSLESRRRGYANSWVISGGRKNGKLLGGTWLKCRKAAVILQVNCGMLRRRRAGAVNLDPVDQVCWIVREDACLSGEAVARDPVPARRLVTRRGLELVESRQLTCRCGCSNHD